MTRAATTPGHRPAPRNPRRGGAAAVALRRLARTSTVVVSRRLARLGVAAWLTVLLGWSAGAQALELLELSARRDDGVQIDFHVRPRLPAAVDDALQRGIALYFVAEAELKRPRWYWRDERIERTRRSWRLSYQPLTSSWRVSQGGLHQTYASQAEALAAISRVSGWKVADARELDPGERYYIEFSYRLDTTQLPRPMQIGVGGQADWALGVEHTIWLP